MSLKRDKIIEWLGIPADDFIAMAQGTEYKSLTKRGKIADDDEIALRREVIRRFVVNKDSGYAIARDMNITRKKVAKIRKMAEAGTSGVPELEGFDFELALMPTLVGKIIYGDDFEPPTFPEPID